MATKRHLVSKIETLLRDAYADHDKGELIDLLVNFEMNGLPSKPLKKMTVRPLRETLDALEAEMENR
jgi:hypothetical protein